MSKIRTHYDNLKVSRSAPQSVIRAAYRALSQQYHPDKNNSPDAARIMQIINHSYSILSDENKRKEHDDWIDKQEEVYKSKKSNDSSSTTSDKEKQEETLKPEESNKTNYQTSNAGSWFPAFFSKDSSIYFVMGFFLFIVVSLIVFKNSAKITLQKDPLSREVANLNAGGYEEFSVTDYKTTKSSNINSEQFFEYYAGDDVYIHIETAGVPSRESQIYLKIHDAGGNIWFEDSKFAYSDSSSYLFVAPITKDWPIGYYTGSISLNNKIVKRLTINIQRRGLSAFKTFAHGGVLVEFPEGVTDEQVDSALKDFASTQSIKNTTPTENYENGVTPVNNQMSSSFSCSLTPANNPWPDRSGYVPEFVKQKTDGYSKVTLDNTSGGSDAFIKLRAPSDTADDSPIRAFIVKRGEKFTINNVSPGLYQIRYQALDTCDFYKSQNFELEEIELENGIRYSEYTLTLYRVRNGNARTTPISAENF